jgi:hypothetical protein
VGALKAKGSGLAQQELTRGWSPILNPGLLLAR